MKIRIIGAGPAGLYFAALMKQHDPSHDIVIYERNPRDATWGFGVVFSDRALEFLEATTSSFTTTLRPIWKTGPRSPLSTTTLAFPLRAMVLPRSEGSSS